MGKEPLLTLSNNLQYLNKPEHLVNIKVVATGITIKESNKKGSVSSGDKSWTRINYFMVNNSFLCVLHSSGGNNLRGLLVAQAVPNSPRPSPLFWAFNSVTHFPVGNYSSSPVHLLICCSVEPLISTFHSDNHTWMYCCCCWGATGDAFYIPHPFPRGHSLLFNYPVRRSSTWNTV